MIMFGFTDDILCQTVEKIKNYPWIFNGPLKFFSKPLAYSHFQWAAASVDIGLSQVDTSRSLIVSLLAPTVSGVALDVIGWRIVQLFHHVKFGGFLHIPLKCRERDTSRITLTVCPAITGNQIEKNKFKILIWIRDLTEAIGEQLVATLAATSKKDNWKVFVVGCLKTSKAQ